MLDILFDAVVMLITLIIATMPFVATAATIYLASVYYSDPERPRNFILRAVMIDAILATIGGSWWAFVALRRVFVGTDAPALPEWTLLFYGLSIIMMTIIPVHKFIVFKRIERLEREEREREEDQFFHDNLTTQE